MSLVASFRVAPMGAPRMTRRDRWANTRSKAAGRYFIYRDALREQHPRLVMPDTYHLVFYLPMPASWSRKIRAAMVGRPHRQKPDKDNLEKGFLDAFHDDDSHFWHGTVTKLWSEEGEIELYAVPPPDIPGLRL